MTPNTKGTIGELAVAQDLLNQSIPVFQSLCNNSRVDLIAVVDSRLVRIQVKYASTKNNVAILFVRKCCLNPKYNYTYNTQDVDVFALYVEDKAEVLYISSAEATKSNRSIAFRYTEPLNKQKNKVRFSKDYKNIRNTLNGPVPVTG